MSRWKVRHGVLCMDDAGRLYTQTIWVPGIPLLDLELVKQPSPEQVYLSRQMRKVARALERDLRETIHRVSSRASPSLACRRILRQVMRSRPPVWRSPPVWSNKNLTDFLLAHNATMTLLKALHAVGGVQASPWSMDSDDVYWDIPEFEPKPKKGGRK